MSELAAGTPFAGHRIEAVVGRGGMGVVYRATQLDLDRTVALKLIAPELMRDATIRRRFLRESKVAASIDHPHVIPIHYAGEESGVPYLAMRYVPGDDVRTLVRREGALDPPRAARIVAQVCSALDAAHAAGLVHRDVKAANVLLAQGEHAYLSDFGLTRHVQSVSGGTASGRWVGTLDYVAPEQIRSGHVDARSDVYSLGCLLFFMLAADVPFPREGDEAKLWAHLTQPPPRVSTTAPGVPRAFDSVIRRALAKSPDERYPSAGDLGRAALAAASGEPVSEPERTVAVGAAAPVEAPTVTSGAPPAVAAEQAAERRIRRLPPAAGVVAVALFAVATATALVVTGDDPEERGRAEPEAPPAATRVVATVKAGPRPNTVALAGGRVWVGAFGAERLTAIDPGANRRLRAVRQEVGEGAADMAATRDALWVAITRGQRLMRLDPVRGRPIGPPGARDARPTALPTRGRDVWVGMELPEGGGEVARVDAETGEVEAAVRGAGGIAGIVFARGSLWTLHGAPVRLVRRDPRSGEPLGRIPLPGTGVGDLALGSAALWATVREEDALMRYELRTGNLAAIAVGDRPAGVAVHDGSVWVAANGSSTVVRVDAASARVVGAPLPVPLNPYAIAAGPGGVWVTCVGESVVVRVQPHE